MSMNTEVTFKEKGLELCVLMEVDRNQTRSRVQLLLIEQCRWNRNCSILLSTLCVCRNENESRLCFQNCWHDPFYFFLDPFCSVNNIHL